MTNGLVFEWHLNTGQMDAILFSYVLVRYSIGRSNTQDIWNSNFKKHWYAHTISLLLFSAQEKCLLKNLWYNVLGENHTPLQRNGMAAIPKIVNNAIVHLLTPIYQLQITFKQVLILIATSNMALKQYQLTLIYIRVNINIYYCCAQVHRTNDVISAGPWHPSF